MALPDSSPSELLDQVLGEYMERLDRGEPVDRSQLLARYPELAEQLQSYFASADEVERLRVERLRVERLRRNVPAQPGARTPVRFTIARTGPAIRQHARYRIKTLRVQASADGGKTWHDLRVSRHGRGYLVVVHDPASGFVSLRSVVTDVRGDATTETIYRKQIRPVMVHSADVMDRIFPSGQRPDA